MNDPMQSDDPEERESYQQKLMAAMRSEASRDKDHLRKQTQQAMLRSKAPLTIGGVDAGGMTST